MPQKPITLKELFFKIPQPFFGYTDPDDGLYLQLKQFRKNAFELNIFFKENQKDIPSHNPQAGVMDANNLEKDFEQFAPLAKYAIYYESGDIYNSHSIICLFDSLELLADYIYKKAWEKELNQDHTQTILGVVDLKNGTALDHKEITIKPTYAVTLPEPMTGESL